MKIVPSSATEAARTEGEKLFEQYLASQGLPFEFEAKYAGKSTVPDYGIEWNGKRHFFDVKDFESPPLPSGSGFAAIQGYKPIRERITRCRKKFKEYKEFCCAAVFFNDDALVMLEHSDFMLGSMYGDSGFKLPFNPEAGTLDASKMERAFLSGGMMVGPGGGPRNTTISALITLTQIRPHYQRLVGMVRAKTKSVSECIAEAEDDPNFNSETTVPRVIVWHNAVARVPFPDDLFCGPYDAHVGIVTTHEGVFQQVTYRGGLLPSHIGL